MNCPAESQHGHQQQTCPECRLKMIHNEDAERSVAVCKDVSVLIGRFEPAYRVETRQKPKEKLRGGDRE